VANGGLPQFALTLTDKNNPNPWFIHILRSMDFYLIKKTLRFFTGLHA
jgi:hypothetical protein